MDSRPGALQLLGLLFTVGVLLSSVSAQTCIKRDQDALLTFKAGLDDPENQLQSWNTTSNCCKEFVGVTCNSKGEVVNLTFAASTDEDCDEDCPFLRSKKAGTDLIGSTLSKLLALQTLDLKYIQLNGPFPSGLGALKNLSFLSLTSLSLQGSLPADLFTITSLKYLSFDGAKGGITDGICKLTNLEVLDLTETVFTGLGIGGTIPSCIGDLQQLTQFLVEWNNIIGAIPDSFRRLQKLQQLKLTGNLLRGPIPAFLGELKTLEVLYLQGNEFTGSIPASLGNLSRLKDLRIGGTSFLDVGSFIDLKFTDIGGGIPTTLGNLKNLQTLWIKGTKITGSIPSALGNAKMLTDLELEFNQLTGSLPWSLSGTNLTIFQVNDNRISGGIPPSYGDLRNLARFVATRNKLTAPIPKELSKLRFPPVGVLDLSDNMITGSIPEDLPLALPFGDLNLSYNMLSGSLKPSSWYTVRVAYLNNNQLTSLGTASIPDYGETGQNVQIFDAHSNMFSGPIPQWPLQFRQALAIDLSDNKFTSLPAISTTLQVSYINVSFNEIYGNIPEELASSRGLNVLDMSRNKLYGPIPASFGSADFNSNNNLNILDLSYNDLTGSIPAGIYDGTFFNTLVLRNNKLTGWIPERSDDNVFLRNVDVSYNMLTGSVPLSVLNSSFINVFKAGNNRLTGGIPNFSVNCFMLTTVVLENNEFVGPVLPSGVSFDTCTALEVFDVSGNNLTGELPTQLTKLLGLKVLDLSSNSLSGRIKDFLSSLSNLLIIDLSNNKFSGTVPWKKLVSGFGALKAAGASVTKYTPAVPLYETKISYGELGGPGSFLRTDFISFSSTSALNFSNNALSGMVDPSIGQLKGLHALDLRKNKFSGTVPDTITDITDLDYLDLSYNNFTGPISPKLRKFPARSFEANPKLCGAPLPNRCSR